MIRHILSDGTVTNDITGHIVKMEDAKEVYALIDQMNHENRKEDVKDGNKN